MEINEYQKLAMRSLNPKLDAKEMLVNSMLGLCGETGEAADLVKKHLFHGKTLDQEALIKELGDVAWYLAEAATALHVSLETIFQRNVEKLKKRYPDGFSIKASIERKDEND